MGLQIEGGVDQSGDGNQTESNPHPPCEFSCVFYGRINIVCMFVCFTVL